MSTLEYIHLKNEKKEKEIDIVSINTNGPVINNNVNNIFLLSNSLPFVITNYDNKTYDYFLDKLDFFPVSIIHGIVFIIGKSYVFKFPKEKN
ncbi:MAG: hypothetical protein K2X95_11550 [Flavobacteriaceae bacterium]|nr:hypothetical protein [Flavobacteriaceae bacterium]